MDYKDIKLNGVIPSPIDERDYPITKLIPKLNVFTDEYITEYKHDALDQSYFGACVWFTIAHLAQYTQEKQSGIFTVLSPFSGYANREKTDYQGDGTIPREAYKNYQKYGIAPTSIFNIIKEVPELYTYFNANKEAILKSAFQYRISSYAKISTDTDYKSTILQRGMAPIIIPVYESFYKTGSNGIVPLPDIKKEKLLGNHSVCGIGWKKLYPHVALNSWGKNWGDKGKLYLPKGYPIVERWLLCDDVLPILSNKIDDHKFYRVQLTTTFTTEYATRVSIAKIKANGYLAVVEKINDKTLVVQVQSFTTQDKAIALQSVLKKLGFSTVVNYY